MAVGTSFTAPGIQTILAEQLTASTWTIVPTPTIAGVQTALLSSVSCAHARACTAVGYTVTSRTNSVVRALAEQWNGSSWTTEATPVPVGAQWTELTSVSCARANSCIAVGGYIKGGVNAVELPLAEQWNGSTWSVLRTPNPHAENGSSFNAVDCVAPGRCEVVGEYAYGDVDQSVIAYSYAGRMWTPQTQVNPGGQSINSNNAVSCTASDACMSAGSWTDTGPLALAESWDGTSWQRRHVPRPAHAGTDELLGVSCATTTACTAVGDSATSANGYPEATMAAQWDGVSWHIVGTPNPASASNTLSAVSCAAPAACVAVGASYTSSSSTTLAETYSK
jgi:hypothetical protein